ncbi:ribonucleoside-diphosphate reductase subunit alpha [uncultured Flavobacterium sp.]|uniref:ribonucleoside-diphosphate reductase subunit alpha n=1 Tax=uncultured Flavobacterium sp. TaxID=165435 RepID=UPI00259A68A6|nr:ribonucleoside-diphosphate reductase subunit alpha [uncultured Flavobacterium sp.]
MITKVKKRNGEYEPFNADKINKWMEWSSSIGVDWTDIAREAYRKCFDGCSTTDIQKSLISACLDKADTNHLRMAGRLYIGDIYKKVFGSCKNVPSVKSMYHKMILIGRWDNMNYSDSELDYLDTIINHDRDLSCIYSELKQICNKYAISDLSTGQLYETPQFVYMRVALGSMNNRNKETRIQDVVNVYNLLSNKEINAPTPYMLYFGTKHRGLSSCCLYTSSDNIGSLAAGDHIAYMMTAMSAGIGAHLQTRSIGDPVRDGSIIHQGKIPYYRSLEGVLLANKQGARSGAATVHYSVLDPEIFDLISLRNPMSIAEKRIPNIDYSTGYNDYFAYKVANNEDWMLISYYYAKDLWDAFYGNDLNLFRSLYQKYEKDDSIPKKFVSARKIAFAFLKEAPETGRSYHHNIYEINRHTPFLDKIYSSNLCKEVVVPTSPYSHVLELFKNDSDGEIGLCNLMAICQGRIKDDAHYEMAAYYCLAIIYEAINIMNYPFPSLEYSAKARMSAGVGVVNLAYDMANKGFVYDHPSGKAYIHKVAERHSYFLHKAAIKITGEKGVCLWTHKTKYPNGWLPIDTYKKSVDSVVENKLIYDWELLRSQIINLGGLAFSVLEAHMPAESSSLASNVTNSLYPIRKGIVIKTNGTDKNVFIAPNWEDLKYQYQLAETIDSKDLIDMYAIFQKFTGQAISADLYLKYNNDGSKRKVSGKKLMNDFLYAASLGVKTRYYLNVFAGVDIINEEEKGCAGGSCTL